MENVEDDSSKLRSSMWQYFNRQQVNGEWKAKCNYCFKLLRGNTRNGTKHLYYHLQRCKRKGIKDFRQMILTNNFSKNWKELKVGIFDQENSIRLLSRMITMHEYPFLLLNILDFKSIQFLSNLYSRSHLTKP